MRLIILPFCLTLGLISPLTAQHQPRTPNATSSLGNCQTGTAFQDLDVNGVVARMYNTGGMYRRDGDPLYNVPAGTDAQAMFAAGVWLGGLVNGELRMVGSEFGPWELWPGPLDRNGNPPANCADFDRIYKVSRRDFSAIEEGGWINPDILDWPWQIGAPVEDGDGNPNNYNLAGGDRPFVEGDQSVWWIMNDRGNEHSWSRTQPIGVEIAVNAFAASASETEVNYSTYYRYTLRNKSGSDLDSAYFGIFADVDLGDAGDDYIGFDTTTGLAYEWNGDDFDGGETGYGDKPPAIGYSVVEGILVDHDGLDNDHDGVTDEEGERIGIGKFVTYSGTSGAQGIPQDGGEAYNYLRGLWRDGEPITLGGLGRYFSDVPVDFMYTGNPPSFWSEEDINGAGLRNPPSDRLFLWSVGPFRLPAGSTKTLVFALTWASGGDRFASVQQLKAAVPKVRSAFEEGFHGSETLEPPRDIPELLAPGRGATGQPRNATLRWTDVAFTDGYDLELATPEGVLSREFVKTRDVPSAVGGGEVEHIVDVPGGTQITWRVRGSNGVGTGPWSASAEFSTGDVLMTSAGPLAIEGGNALLGGSPAFIQVEGIGPDDACGPSAGSSFGCAEVGGNFVYGSFNGQGDWIMYHQGNGSEYTIGGFAPQDFELRSTEAGSIGYHGFTSGNVIWVPLELWDIGPVGPFGVNDPSDDVQLIAVLSSDNGGECFFGFGELPDDPFGLGWPGTDRIYAYYPVADYGGWEAAMKPLVDGDPEGCPDGPGWDVGDPMVDRERGRPIQRLIFMMDPESPNYRDEMIPVGNVIRFLTISSTGPIPSSPTNGEVVSTDPLTLRWNLAPDSDSTFVEVATDQQFSNVVYRAVTTESSIEPQGLVDGATYFWRVRDAQSSWSDVWQFSVDAGVGTEVADNVLPVNVTLESVYPNPVSGTANLRIGAPRAGIYTIRLYNPLGQLVTRVAELSLRPGWHRISWKRDDIASGAYYMVLRGAGQQRARSVVVVGTPRN